MGIAENIEHIRSEIGDEVTLVAVSKYSTTDEIRCAYAAGQRDFGENKAQALDARHVELPADIRWHFIGHLQRNKVKYISGYVYMIQSVDSWRLLKEINKQAKKADRVIPCLLQLHIARESTKFGLDENELDALLSNPGLAEMEHVAVEGLMGMATNTDDKERVKSEFSGLKAIFDRLKAQELPPNVQMKTLSMGMSQDYRLAIDAGSSLVRIGTAVFKN